MNLALASRNPVGELGQLIPASRASISTAAVSALGRRSMPFRFEVSRLAQEQEELERRYDLFLRQSARPGPGDLGWILPVAIIGGSAVASLAAWAWKHHEETSRVEARAELFDRLVADGMDAGEAADKAFGGGGGGITEILDKLVIIGLLGIGGYFVLKTWG